MSTYKIPTERFHACRCAPHESEFKAFGIQAVKSSCSGFRTVFICLCSSILFFLYSTSKTSVFKAGTAVLSEYVCIWIYTLPLQRQIFRDLSLV